MVHSTIDILIKNSSNKYGFDKYSRAFIKYYIKKFIEIVVPVIEDEADSRGYKRKFINSTITQDVLDGSILKINGSKQLKIIPEIPCLAENQDIFLQEVDKKSGDLNMNPEQVEVA